MARKKTEFTEEERLENEKQYAIDAFCKKEGKHINEPTYFFKVGDKVRMGGFSDVTVDEVLFDGKAYGLICISDNEKSRNKHEKCYRVSAWNDVRNFDYGNTDFAKNQDIRISFDNSSIDSLLSLYYGLGIDMNPDYQRDYVWNECDKVLLIDSIFNNIDIGKFVLIHLDYGEYVRRNCSYEILDGKQRLSTLIDFYENRFPYNGKYYNDLSKNDQRAFEDHMISIGKINECDRKSVLKYFLMLNRTGKSMEKTQLDKVEQMLNECE